MLTFAYPWVALLLPLPWLVSRLSPPRAERRPGLRVPFFDALVALTGARPQSGAVVASRDRWRTGVLAACWLLTLAALARPQRIEAPLRRDQPTRDLLLLVDLSGSMDARDFHNASGQLTDRLTAVKGVLDDFLARRQGDRVGVIVFGDSPFVLVPFTTDLALCRELIRETAVGMAGPRTVLGDALGLGITLFDQSRARARTVIALTDGNDTASRVPPPEAARIAKDKGIVVHTVAIGDPAAVGEEKLDEEALRDVAATTGGGFYRALDREALADIYRRLDAIETRRIETVSFRPRTDLYWVPLGLALLLSLSAQALGLALASRPASQAASHSGGTA
ncbi:VWA domain-containing protein [Methylobacterium nigriterrae]|uniref:VWA domain-containing protein n=1 Tax=Methylobacterium nigriterrae TaxID=3127512 RepID=UPI003013FFE4